MENKTQGLHTNQLLHQLDMIFDFASPEEYRDTLLEIYHNYILHEHKDMPDQFEQMAMRMSLLLEFLREAGLEKRTGPLHSS